MHRRLIGQSQALLADRYLTSGTWAAINGGSNRRLSRSRPVERLPVAQSRYSKEVVAFSGVPTASSSIKAFSGGLTPHRGLVSILRDYWTSAAKTSPAVICGGLGSTAFAAGLPILHCFTFALEASCPSLVLKTLVDTITPLPASTQ